IATQPLLARGLTVSIIDNDTEMIRVAGQFGMKVYYGDGTRLDILHAAGAETADAVLIAVNDKGQATRIAELVKAEFPLTKVLARAFDRVHAMELVKLGVDYHVREVFESALAFGQETILQLGATVEEAAEVIEGVRQRDRMRFEAQVLGDVQVAREFTLRYTEHEAREVARTGESTELIVPSDEQPEKV